MCVCRGGGGVNHSKQKCIRHLVPIFQSNHDKSSIIYSVQHTHKVDGGGGG